MNLWHVCRRCFGTQRRQIIAIGFYLHSCAGLGVRAVWLNPQSPDSLHVIRALSLAWEHFCSRLWRRLHSSPRKHGPPPSSEAPHPRADGADLRAAEVRSWPSGVPRGGRWPDGARTQGAADRQLFSSSRGGLPSCVRGHRSRSTALDDRLRVADDSCWTVPSSDGATPTASSCSVL